MFKLYTANAEERRRLGALRASAWRGAFSEAEFLERNERLYAHPYGRDHVTTYALKDERDYLCASMDILEIDLLIKTASGTKQEAGYLVASVITAPQDRKNGYASRLMNLFLEKFPEKSGVLYSDIGPPFYARVGFHEKLMRSREADALAGAALPKPMAFNAGVERLRAERERIVKAAKAPAGAVLPSLSWLDWEVERYRYFAEIALRPFPESFFYEVTDGHLLYAIPHFPANQLDILWMPQGCETCQAAAGALAASLGLAKTHWWDESLEAASGKTECPMIKIAGQRAPAFLDPQLCDWW